MSNTLIPNYVDIDYTTMLNRLKTILSKSDTFKDYDFEGSNIKMLMELVSYLGDVNTYYTNSLAKNIHNETADVYEVVHSLVRRQGHDPLGYISSSVSVTLTLKCTNDPLYDKDNPIYDPTAPEYDSSATLPTDLYYLPKEYAGQELRIPQWYIISLKTDDVWFTLTEPILHFIDIGYIPPAIGSYDYNITLNMVQGKPLLSELVFNYDDIVDNRLYLPFNKWDHNISNKSTQVIINDEIVYDRVDDITDYQNVNYPLSYTMKYDKYGRYYIKFTSIEDIPSESNVVKILLVESLGLDGIIGRLSVWDKTTECNIYNYSKMAPFITRWDGIDAVELEDINLFELTNNEGSVGGSNPQTVSELKVSGNSNIFSQLRNVTPTDYANHLISLPDVDRAIAWGEHEVTAGSVEVDTSKFNNIYISVIPSIWNSNTIVLETMKWIKDNHYYIDNLVYNNGKFFKCIVEHDTIGQDSSFFLSGRYVIDNEPIGQVDDQLCWTFVGTPTEDYLLEYFNNKNVGPLNLRLPQYISSDFNYKLLVYLNTRKMIGVDEICLLPHPVYFKFELGIRAKRSYVWPNVKYDVESKLLYYFTNEFRVFGDVIDTNDILSFIYDTSIVSPTNDFSNVKGVQNISFRNVSTFTPDNLLKWPYHKEAGYVYSQYDINDTSKQPFIEHPFYMNVGSIVNNNSKSTFDNYMKPIKLGFNQYPILSAEYCEYYNEER